MASGLIPVIHTKVAPGKSMVVKSPFTKEEAPVYPIQRTWRKSQASFTVHNSALSSARA
jgi:hypothetical protein